VNHVFSLVEVKERWWLAGLQVGDYCLQPIGRSHVRSDQGLVLHVVVKTSRLGHSLVIPLHVVIVRHRRHLPQHAFGIHQYLLHHRLQAL